MYPFSHEHWYWLGPVVVHTALFLHGLSWLQVSTVWSQFCPVNPLKHMQLYECRAVLGNVQAGAVHLAYDIIAIIQAVPTISVELLAYITNF